MRPMPAAAPRSMSGPWSNRSTGVMRSPPSTAATLTPIGLTFARAPSRGKVGESVKQINYGFPHWFNSRFKEFNDHPDRLPFDQHCLVALVAPRPVLLTNAVEDTWANPQGQFEVLRAADPVYRLLGAGGLEAKRPPEPGKLSDG